MSALACYTLLSLGILARWRLRDSDELPPLGAAMSEFLVISLLVLLTFSGAFVLSERLARSLTRSRREQRGRAQSREGETWALERQHDEFEA